ncbi:hypothetical protein PLICRDRAFT_698078 [Plicaturopsis crispa FD-325 SS-3]|nr:hypothetical protein PLICRDRAFT_698078 [Plicaturopsis crispa FD-325 SS-3]
MYTCIDCPGRTFKSSGGLTRHRNTVHRELSPGSDNSNQDPPIPRQYHPHLNAIPCNEHGEPLPDYAPPPPPPPPTHGNHNGGTTPSWFPFGSRIDFDFAYYHFVERESSISQINKALDMWAATVHQYGGGTPWANAQELYDTIDEIKLGNAPWKSYTIRYEGPLPPTPPKWMTESYELCTRDARQVLHLQLDTPDFKQKFEPVPYRQFNTKQERVYSNFMSGDWAWKQADTIHATDPTTSGAMFMPIITGSDKTTVSVATGHQEFHPVYMSPGPVTNTARRAHGNSVLPVAFLPIPKTAKRHRKKPAYQKFCRQMYHSCLARIFTPLKPGMTAPELVRCPDGYFRHAIYGLGPYIADYPEQVWLAAIVQGWCPKCNARPENLDTDNARRRSHEKTDFLITCFDPGILWFEYGVRTDVVPFTHNFPRADIHELLSPDLLHQVIKGTFKDHIVTWVNEYLHQVHSEARANEIIDDIDRRISAVPPFPGLRRFPEGRDFSQWTGDDSKALMKVYLAAIAGHVPSDMVKCLSAFLDFCYIARRNAIDTTALAEMEDALSRFHRYREVFIRVGVRPQGISLPRQHSLKHYIRSIQLFRSPNGLCSSITESKHIKAVKKPWRRSSQFKAMHQMLRINTRVDKVEAACREFTKHGMMSGTTLSYTERMLAGEEPQPPAELEGNEDDDHGPESGPKVLSSVELARTPQTGYGKTIAEVAANIHQPRLPELVRRFLYDQTHPNSALPSADVPLDLCPQFSGRISVFHSAVARFYAPSDLCGAGGMYRERIRCNPNWRGEYARHDTVFIDVDSELPGMEGMVIGRVFLFFSFTFGDEHYPCALVHWMEPIGLDDDTGMWVVRPEYEGNGRPSVAVVHLDSIPRASHLIGRYGSAFIPDDLHFSRSLDLFRAHYVNPYADHHMHEFLK